MIYPHPSAFHFTLRKSTHPYLTSITPHPPANRPLTAQKDCDNGRLTESVAAPAGRAGSKPGRDPGSCLVSGPAARILSCQAPSRQTCHHQAAAGP
eukprot:762624-Hanusia_phi.AAC.4